MTKPINEVTIKLSDTKPATDMMSDFKFILSVIEKACVETIAETDEEVAEAFINIIEKYRDKRGNNGQKIR